MQVTPELLEKYQLGLCNKQEEKLVEDWLLLDENDSAYPSVPGENDAIREIWEELREEVSPEPVSLIFNTAHIVRIPTSFAACIAVIFSVWYLSGKSGFSPQDSKSASVAFKSLRTSGGERRKYELPDGTVVFLNAGSELRYPENFTDTSRTAWLTGEAFFEVAKDSLRPFTIHTSHSETRVLGTAFSLKAYVEDPMTTLIVQEGKVRFSDTENKESHLILTANEKGILQSGQLESSNVYAAGYTGWKENKLVLNNQQLTEIVPILERWYGIKVNVSSSELGIRRCTGTFANPTLKSLMASLGYSMNFKYKIHDNDVLIY
ncbi:hypothetical protein DSL64_01900 [Dyadobacter luteus]|uniref:FecR family protein n=1 Tax=Dyadobacter luteus TaxID=2259619 RepID=A0A3D8YID8_9BACT|nr:FecR domain-containing protein [Dyadobacter luteus]REA64327.1 hypothetical protein DSL64_01900 [Dyadobacter luteus]